MWPHIPELGRKITTCWNWTSHLKLATPKYIIVGPVSCPGLNHICIWLGLPLPRLLRCPVFMPTPAWELLLVENQCDNTRSNLQILKLTSLSLICEGTPSINLGIICTFDWVLSSWFPTNRSSRIGAGRKSGEWKKCVRGGAQPKTNVI